MITVEGDSIGIKTTGKKADLPDNPIGRLMYYLKTVNGLIDFNIPLSLLKYKKYNLLSFDEENEVLTLAVLLSPDIFIDKGIMIHAPQLCEPYNNQFYEISAMHSAIAITEEFVIGGQRVHTLKIMTFKESWMKKIYFIPIKTYSGRINAIANGTVERFRPRSIVYKTTVSDPYNRHQQFTVYPPRDGAVVLYGSQPHYPKSRVTIRDGYKALSSGSTHKNEKSKCCLLI